VTYYKDWIKYGHDFKKGDVLAAEYNKSLPFSPHPTDQTHTVTHTDGSKHKLVFKNKYVVSVIDEDGNEV